MDPERCAHRIVVDEGRERRCLTCGYTYDRAFRLERLREAIRARRRLPPSPWSQAERSSDPW